MKNLEITRDETNRDEVVGSNRNALSLPLARDRRSRMNEPE